LRGDEDRAAGDVDGREAPHPLGAIAWLGIPFLFVIFVYLVSFLWRVDLNVVLVLAIAFVALGVVAIVKGQRPRRRWIVLLYPLPMVWVLVSLVTFLLILAAGGA
jgi:hypothetical protein